jgi:hypothetical protein
MGRMMTLDVALDRLIHNRSFRRDFMATGGASLEVRAEDAATLGAIDLRTLSDLAERVAAELMSRRHAGSGSLVDLYPRTIEAYCSEHGGHDALIDLACAFMDSPSFERYREIPHAGLGSSLEEAFFRYSEAEGIGDPVGREEEFLAAMAKLFVVSPRAAVSLPREIRRAASGYYGVGTRGTPALYGALRGRYVTGRLTPFLADLLAPEADFAETAKRHGVSDAVLGESLRRFAVLGIF